MQCLYVWQNPLLSMLWRCNVQQHEKFLLYVIDKEAVVKCMTFLCVDMVNVVGIMMFVN